jgi:membrane fusion protein, copper/silver efflux system
MKVLEIIKKALMDHIRHDMKGLVRCYTWFKSALTHKWVQLILAALGGILLGWLLFHSPKPAIKSHQPTEKSAKVEIWTCSMDPQIRMEKPGKCPICGMDLIPLVTSGATYDSSAVHLTLEAAQLANISTSIVSRQSPVKELRLYGKVQADERLLQSQTAHVPGRIEKLYVNFTGEPVRQGQPLALIHSPELITAQEELLETAKIKTEQPELFEAAKDKLRQWKLNDAQINQILRSNRVKNDFEVLAGSSGIVTARRVNTGDYITEGTVLFEVANLSTVWVLFDAYESDLPFLKIGNNVRFRLQALPETEFSAKIRFIDPVIDPISRVAKVRVEVSNSSGKLKPEMFATGIVQANLNQYRDKMVIPSTAVLWTGKRSVVYVKQGHESIFKMREVEIGPMLGNSYVVLDGLSEGEEIVTEGTFSVDAAAQLEGKPSMMNH